jgi:hypothetical protein
MPTRLQKPIAAAPPSTLLSTLLDLLRKVRAAIECFKVFIK